MVEKGCQADLFECSSMASKVTSIFSREELSGSRYVVIGSQFRVTGVVCLVGFYSSTNFLKSGTRYCLQCL